MDPRLELAASLQRAGDLAGAEKALRPVLRECPGLDDAWVALGTNLQLEGRHEAAARAFEVALDISPRHPGARRGVGFRPRDDAVPVLPHAVAVVCETLAGARGRMAVDVANAVAGGVLLCADAGEFAGMGLEAEAEVPVACVADLREALGRLRPRAVVDFRGTGAARVGDEAWVGVACGAGTGGAGAGGAAGVDDRVIAASRFASPDGAEVIRPVAHCVRGGVLSPRRVGMLGRLDPGRFPLRFPRMAQALDDLRLEWEIVGGGARRWELQHDPVVGFEFLGPLPTPDMREWLATLSFGVYWTETHETGTGCSVLDLLGAGLPVVAMARGCVPELVEDGVSGLLASNEGELERAVRRVAVDEGLRRRLAEGARERAGRYGFGVFLQAWAGVISTV